MKQTRAANGNAYCIASASSTRRGHRGMRTCERRAANEAYGSPGEIEAILQRIRGNGGELRLH
jgi:hypothetical protein